MDGSGNAYVTGYTFSADFIGGSNDGGTNNSYKGGLDDAFVAKLTSAGALSWATYLGGSSTDDGRGIAVDGSGNAYVTGRTYSADFIGGSNDGGTNNSNKGGAADAFVAKLTALTAPQNPVLIVPGILGSMPASDFSGWLVKSDSAMHPLNMVIDPIMRTYDDLIESFRLLGYNDDSDSGFVDLWAAPYDWRCAVAPRDGSTDGHIDTGGISSSDSVWEYGIEYLDYWIDAARTEWVSAGYAAADFAVDIVGHSMGGLVARSYIQSDFYDEGSIDSLLMLGTPNHGAVDAYQWREWINDSINFVLDEAVKAVAAGLSTTGIGSVVGALLVTGAKAIDVPVIEQYSPSITDLLPTFSFISKVWPHWDVKDIDDNVLLADLNTSYGSYYGSGGVEAKVLYGTGTETDYELYHPLGMELFNIVGFDGLPVGNGDGIVLASSAMLGGVQLEALPGITHGQLGGASVAVQQEVFDYLGFDVPLGFAYHTGDYRSLLSAATDAVSALIGITDPVDVVVTDPSGNRIGYSGSQGAFGEIDDAYYTGDGAFEFLLIPTPADGQYTVTYEGLGTDFVGVWVAIENGGSTAWSSTGTLGAQETVTETIDLSIDDVGPRVLSDPPLPATVTQTVSEIHLRFSEMLDPATAASPANYTLMGPSGEVVLGSVVYDPDDVVVVLSPVGDGLPAGEYVLTVNGTSSVRDLAGNTLDGDADGTPGGDYTTQFAVLPAPAANGPPDAEDDAYETDEDGGLSVDAQTGVLASDSDPDDDPLTAALVSGASNGSLTLNADGSFTYTPIANWHGVDSFSYVANDGAEDSGLATVTIVVNAVNDAPAVVTQITDVTVDEDAADSVVDLSVAFDDVDILTTGDDLTLSVTGNSGSSLVGTDLVGRTLTLSYAADQNGTADVTIRGTDNQGAYAEDTFTVTVSPVNDAPVAYSGAVAVTEDGSVAIALSGGDVETAEGDLTFTITSLPAEGVLLYGGTPAETGDSFTGSPNGLTYEPGVEREGAGTDSFTFTVTDRGDPDTPGVVGLTSAPAAISVDIIPCVEPGAVTVDLAGVVRIGGTPDDDVIAITHTGDNRHLAVTINGVLVSSAIPLADVSENRD